MSLQDEQTFDWNLWQVRDSGDLNSQSESALLCCRYGSATAVHTWPPWCMPTTPLGISEELASNDIYKFTLALGPPFYRSCPKPYKISFVSTFCLTPLTIETEFQIEKLTKRVTTLTKKL